MDAETLKILQYCRKIINGTLACSGAKILETTDRIDAIIARHNEQAARSQDSTLAQLGDAADPAAVAAAPYMHEDALPHMKQESYYAWYAKSWLQDGVRVGPVVAAESAAENTDEIIQPDFDSLAREPEQASESADDGTPETDAAEETEKIYQTRLYYHSLHGGSQGELPPSGWVKARKIERDRNRLQRENAELRTNNERLKHINCGLCNEHNTLLIDGSKWQTKAEAAERELSALQSTLTIHCETHGVVQAAACKYCVSELAAAQERIAGLEVSFRVNMLRLRPEMSHEEIDAVIASAGGKS